MTRHYGQVIQVRQAQGKPESFVWRGQTYRVRAIWATWHLRDRWWATGEEGVSAASDRRYYRVSCTGGFLCDLYHDASTDYWVLDRVHD